MEDGFGPLPNNCASAGVHWDGPAPTDSRKALLQALPDPLHSNAAVVLPAWDSAPHLRIHHIDDPQVREFASKQSASLLQEP
eukprot:CAMPEP_0117693530 /NCGR_PEP_ID=MMETSP0804-20121206/26933_1 /TAXON_ID=1074897 /ORGANISM="Tetraselmis astigmatica, Strain CCMP880" /LENGTH=81 /DNA_ID=CAMNT_0005507097 /DNA_START=37 /DNA_END=281 /DNA_ORIENTATION=+